tara:strand:+ start:532 stop:816 length:285 start_codon:yes stop_codon:yes gene_type:complete
MRKKHSKPKNLRKIDEHYRYFLLEIERKNTDEIYIHRETQIIIDEEEYIINKIDFIREIYNPELVVPGISALGKWEYYALKNAGVKLFSDLWES